MSKQFKPSEPPPHTASDSIPHVPKELIDELHEANDQFSGAREHREKAVDEPTYDHGSRDEAAQEVRDAEKNVEQVTSKIDKILKSPKSS